MLMLKPLFNGENTHMQIVEIIKKLGSPSEDDIKAMNPDYEERFFPKLKQ